MTERREYERDDFPDEERYQGHLRNLEAGRLAQSLGIDACPQCGSTKRNGLLIGCDRRPHSWHDAYGLHCKLELRA
jgi:hypothetical protein